MSQDTLPAFLAIQLKVNEGEMLQQLQRAGMALRPVEPLLDVVGQGRVLAQQHHALHTLLDSLGTSRGQLTVHNASLESLSLQKGRLRLESMRLLATDGCHPLVTGGSSVGA